MSFSMNNVVLGGNIVKDPQRRDMKSGTVECLLRLAVNRSYKAQDGTWKEEAHYFDVAVFGRQAEQCLKLHKGAPILAEGRLRFAEWQDKETGQKRSKVDVVASRVHFVGPRPAAGGGPDEHHGGDGGSDEIGGHGAHVSQGAAPYHAPDAGAAGGEAIPF